MDQNKWFMAEGAKVCLEEKAKPGISLELSKFSLTSNISRWNRRAADDSNGYEADVKNFKWVAPAEMARMLSPYLHEGQEVLDLGCGSGLVGKAFEELGQVNNLIFDGVDFSANMLVKAKQRGYRNLVCANLSQEDLASAVWDDLGTEKKYSTLVSVGVYGDFLNPVDLEYAFNLADKHSVVAVAGREAIHPFIPSVFKIFGFEVVHSEKGVAHYEPDSSNCVKNPEAFFTSLLGSGSLLNPEQVGVNYSYFIGKR